MKKTLPILEKTEQEKEAAEAQILELSKRIEFYLTEYSVELLASKMHQGEFVVPSYQRAFTWETERKSRFIESVLMGLPIPFLFFWEMPDGRLEIVDGSQRLRTLEEFLHGGLRLTDLEGLTAVSGFTFGDLPPSRQRKLSNRSIRGIVLNEHADEQARFDMFERINTGSKLANKAEVRRGALAGAFMEIIVDLANTALFASLAPVSKKDLDEREREELVTRFFAYGDGLEGYRDRPSEFLFGYVKKMNREVETDPTLGPTYRHRFNTTMTFIHEVFSYGFRRSTKGKATPRARFEAIAIGSLLALREDPHLTPAMVPNVNDWIDSKEFKERIGSDGANARSRLEQRMYFVRDKLLGR